MGWAKSREAIENTFPTKGETRFQSQRDMWFSRDLRACLSGLSEAHRHDYSEGVRVIARANLDWLVAVAKRQLDLLGVQSAEAIE